LRCDIFSMNDFIRLLTLQDANTRTVLLGATLLGAASGVISAFAVLRRRALMGDALAHAALPGVVVAYFIVGDRNFLAFLIGALVFGVLGVLCVAFIRAYTRIKEDAAIGIVLSSFFGLGISLSRIAQSQPSGNRSGLDGFLFGKAASMVRSDVLAIAAVAGVIVLVVAVLFRQFKVLCFDREFAASLGLPVLLLDLGLMTLICVCTVVGLPAVGVVLVAALLIIPGVTARFWTDRLGMMVLISATVGGFAGLMGTALSAVLPAPPGALTRGLPTGPLIALTAAACFIVSMLASPRRGVIADALRRRSLRRAIEAGHRPFDADGNVLAAPLRARGETALGDGAGEERG
jgi:manganese/zinc/iron transport system permease protein